MKKMLSFVLCFTLLIFSTVQPVAASYDDGTVVEHLVDDRGYIITPGNYSFAGLAIAGASGAGFLGGSATLLGPGALGILAILIASGFEFSSVSGYAAEANRLYSALSETAQSWFDTAVESGSEAIELTSDAYAQLNQAYSEQLFIDGSLRTTGYVDLGLTGFLDFNQNDKIDSNTLDTDIDFYNLSESSFVNIPDTNLAVRLVSDISSLGYSGTSTNYGLEVTNLVTGVSLFLVDEFIPIEERIDDCCSLSISAPTAYTKEWVSSGTQNTSIGFWLLRNCTNSSHTQQYYSTHYPQLDSGQVVSSVAPFMVMGDCLADGLSGVWFDGWNFDPNTGNIVWNLIDGTTLDVGQTPQVMTASEPYYTITKDNAYDLPGAGTTLTLPSNEALKNVNTITPAQVLADTATPENPGDSPGLEHDGTVLGVLKAILNALAVTGPVGLALSAIVNGISDLYQQVGSLTTAWDLYWQDVISSVKSLPQAIGQTITNVLVEVFVPSAEFFDTYIEDMTALFDERLGILTYPISVLFDLLNRFMSLGSQEPVLRWSAVNMFGVDVIPAGQYNLNEVLQNSAFKRVHDIYLIIVDATITFGLLNLLRRKYESIIGG